MARCRGAPAAGDGVFVPLAVDLTLPVVELMRSMSLSGPLWDTRSGGSTSAFLIMTAGLASVANPNENRGRWLTVAAMALLIPALVINALDESGKERTFLFVVAAVALAVLVSALLGDTFRRRNK